MYLRTYILNIYTHIYMYIVNKTNSLLRVILKVQFCFMRMRLSLIVSKVDALCVGSPEGFRGKKDGSQLTTTLRFFFRESRVGIPRV